MTETTLKEILDELCAERAAEYGKLKFKPHFFSPRHRNAMRKILYPYALPQSAEGVSRCRNIPTGKGLLILLMVIFTAMISVTAGANMSHGFILKERPAFTELYAANSEDSPKKIKYRYYLPMVPDGYELYEDNYYSPYNITVFYKNTTTKRNMTFSQDVKYGHIQYFDNERNTIEEIFVNGKYGLYLKPNDKNDPSGSIVWDNGDYILYIGGKFTKEQLLDMAESVTVYEPQKGVSALQI